MTERGNPDNLRAAARRKHEHAVNRAEQAIRALVRAQDPVSFRAVARLAECSPDFLYRTPQLRSRIEALRAEPRRTAPPPPSADSTSGVVRELRAPQTPSVSATSTSRPCATTRAPNSTHESPSTIRRSLWFLEKIKLVHRGWQRRVAANAVGTAGTCEPRCGYGARQRDRSTRQGARECGVARYCETRRSSERIRC